MDIIFVNTMYFQELHTTDLGSIILQNRLDRNIESLIVNFDRLLREGELRLPDSCDDIWDTYANYIARFKPKIVQFYTVCLTYPFSILVAKRLKKINKDVIIIFGGPQVSAAPYDNIEKYDFIDVIGIGEGEPYFNSLIKALLASNDISKIPGIAYRNNLGEIIINKKTANFDFTKDYSADYMHYDYGREFSYFYSQSTKDDYSIDIQIEAGRGCPFNCTFCSTSIFWERKCRLKEQTVLVEEINELQRKYGFEYYSLDHDMFTTNRKYIVDFCDLITRQECKWKWKCSSRIDTLDLDLIKRMKKANCYGIYVGIETGSQSMQYILRKNLNVSGLIGKIKSIIDEGIELTTSFIYGFYDETEKDFLETISLIEHCFIMNVNTIQLHKFFPLTNTIEGEKVKGMLALDLKKCDLSIAFNYHVLTNEVVDLLREDPDNFSCFYDFATEVRRKYSRMDFLVSCFSGLYFVFSRTINYLIINHGLQEIYLSCERIISHYANELQSRSILDSFYRKNELNLFHGTMNEIANFYLCGCEKGNLYLQELNRFDENVYLYMTYDFETEMVFKLQCNVFDKVWNVIPTYYKIYRMNGKLCVERLTKKQSDGNDVSQ